MRGFFVGLRERSEEVLVMTHMGVFRARIIRRKSEEEMGCCISAGMCGFTFDASTIGGSSTCHSTASRGQCTSLGQRADSGVNTSNSC